MTGSRKLDQTDKRPHKSLYKGGYVTSADYICELIFKIRAEIFKTVYPESFWNTGKFKGQYVGQKIQASKLLKKYSPASIIRAVKQVRPVKLNDPKLKPVIEKFERQQSEREIVKIEPKPINNAPKRKTKRSKLEGL